MLSTSPYQLSWLLVILHIVRSSSHYIKQFIHRHGMFYVVIIAVYITHLYMDTHLYCHLQNRGCPKGSKCIGQKRECGEDEDCFQYKYEPVCIASR